MKNLLLGLGVFLLTASSCQKDQDVNFESEEVVIDWSDAAKQSTNMLIEQYWNSQENFFNYRNDGSSEFHYWPQAHGLQVILDGYERTNDEYFKSYITSWHKGVPIKNNGWYNHFIDDMEWNTIALTRAYTLTNEEKYLDAAQLMWNDIKKYWTKEHGGGLKWTKDQNAPKNACSNGPGAIIALKMYGINKSKDDLNWAKKIYEWEKSVLVDPATGAVWDHINEHGNIQKNWLFTYNQGTYLGSALGLYEATKEQHYLNDAIKAANFTLSNLTNPNDGLLKDEGAGDGGIFKGIFIRYFVQLIMCDDITDSTREKYIRFLKHNAEKAWTKGRHETTGCYGSYWMNKPDDVVDYTVQLSACMLMEAMDVLKRNNYLDEKK